MPQKLFRVKIYAYQYHADFIVKCSDSALDIENAIVDTLGKDDIKWDYLGEMMNPKVNRITYEEVINGGDMVKIDRKVREVISQIKLAEAEKADAQNRIDAAAPQVSVAT
jgi:hypothetical protein